MLVNKVRKNTQRRVRDYFDYIWNAQQGFDADVIFKNLPFTLAQDLETVMKFKFIKSVPYFSQCPPKVISALACALEKLGEIIQSVLQFCR